MIINDTLLFESIAREFIVRYVEKTALALHGQDSFDFDLNDLRQKDEDALYNMCFAGVIGFDELAGVVRSGETYTPLVAFENRQSDDTFLLLGHTLLHGLLDSQAISEGIRNAQGALQK